MAGALSGLAAVLPLPRAASLTGLASLALQVAVGAAVYFASLSLLRSPELPAFRALLRRG